LAAGDAENRRMGYTTGRQWLLRRPTIWKGTGAMPRCSLILEKFLPFTCRELSILAYEWPTDIAFYPLIENHHATGSSVVAGAGS